MGPGAWTSSETTAAGLARPVRTAPPPPPPPHWSPYSLTDLIALLWRERFVMLGVFVAIVALSIALALTLKKTYTAYSAVVVQLGQEYVYEPRVGEAGRGTPATAGQMVQSELSILQSTAVKERVIADIGLTRLYPKLGQPYASASRARQRVLYDTAVRTMSEAFKVQTAPETSVVHLSFTHEDPLLAAEVLNRLVEAYLAYRKEVLVGGDPRVLDEQRRLFETRLAAADAAYQQFLTEASVGDFETEKTSLAQVYASLLTERYSIDAQLSEVEGRLGVTRRQASQAPPEIGLYQDSDPTATNKLTQLKVERQDLLSRYRPDSQPVREIDQKISALETLITQGGAAGVGARRTGPNPVFQSLTTERNQLEAQAASLRSRRAAVNADLEQVNRRRQQLMMLEPRYQDLVRQRDVLSNNVKAFTAREQETRAAREIAIKGDNGSVRLVERAYAPTKPKSLRTPVAALGVLFGGFTALCVALARILLRRGFVTPEATARSLELPVLATAPVKRAGA